MIKPAREKKMRTHLISAICTPLKDDDSLHVDGLAVHLDDQFRHGISGVLIGGTMGLMQLLDDTIYRDLVRHGVQLAHGRGEVFVGAGDTSLARTLHRIQYIEQFDVDGIVVLAPFFYPLEQADLVAYFQELANRSRRPLYLYDLPGLIKTSLDVETVVQLSKHPNIRGVKCSNGWTETRRLMDCVANGFRVVPAQANMVDMLVRCGVRDNLDGIFSIVPDLTASIAEASECGDYALAASQQGKLTEFLQLIVTKYPLFPACSALLNAKGVPGRVHPSPMKSLEPEYWERLRGEPIVRELFGTITLARI
jgi:4-hydroxy-tetrahydrodipicolinate synthase